MAEAPTITFRDELGVRWTVARITTSHAGLVTLRFLSDTSTCRETTVVELDEASWLELNEAAWRSILNGADPCAE